MNMIYSLIFMQQIFVKHLLSMKYVIRQKWPDPHYRRLEFWDKVRGTRKYRNKNKYVNKKSFRVVISMQIIKMKVIEV